MKLKRLLTLCCALSMALGMVTFASAADYSLRWNFATNRSVGFESLSLIASRRSLWKGFSSASPTATAALWQMRVVSSLPTVFI